MAFHGYAKQPEGNLKGSILIRSFLDSPNPNHHSDVAVFGQAEISPDLVFQHEKKRFILFTDDNSERFQISPRKCGVEML